MEVASLLIQEHSAFSIHCQGAINAYIYSMRYNASIGTSSALFVCLFVYLLHSVGQPKTIFLDQRSCLLVGNELMTEVIMNCKKKYDSSKKQDKASIA